MKRRPSPILAVVLALLLLCAQQGAFAHLIGHLDATSQSSVQQGEQNHDAALALADACTTCLALSALGGPPSPAAQVAAPPLGTDQTPRFDPSHFPALPRPQQRARAPPCLP